MINFKDDLFDGQSYSRMLQTPIFRPMFRRALFFVILIGVFCRPMAQDLSEEIPTNNTVRKKFDHRKNDPKIKRYDRLYSKNTKGTMYGNPCAIDVTHKMGFEYVPLVQGHGKSPMGYFLNNLLVKSKLVLTRTPFWKMILNKRLDDCRLRSGDGIG